MRPLKRGKRAICCLCLSAATALATPEGIKEAKISKLEWLEVKLNTTTSRHPTFDIEWLISTKYQDTIICFVKPSSIWERHGDRWTRPGGMGEWSMDPDKVIQRLQYECSQYFTRVTQALGYKKWAKLDIVRTFEFSDKEIEEETPKAWDYQPPDTRQFE